MTSYSDAIKARYAASEEERDGFGRMIFVQRLRPYDATRIRRIADSTRANVVVDVLVAASVRKIVDEEGREGLFAPPRDEDDLAIVMNALDAEGFEAASRAYIRLMGLDKKDDKGGAVETEVDTAKN